MSSGLQHLNPIVQLDFVIGDDAPVGNLAIWIHTQRFKHALLISDEISGCFQLALHLVDVVLHVLPHVLVVRRPPK